MKTTRPNLALHPLHHTTADIVKCFALGKQLTPDQLNFLDWHQTQLDDPSFNSILNYYLQSRRHSQKDLHTSFLLPHEEMNREAIALLKKRLKLMLQANSEHRVAVNVTQKQFMQFREYTIQELIFWHGNQFLTGAPFYPGGTPPQILFQWGNFFGIVKYVVISGEKAVMGNLLLYFEEMQERTLDHCVHDYQKRREKEKQLQNNCLDNKIMHTAEPKQLVKAPDLTMSKYYLIDPLPAPKPW